jgi:hypothetical protein
VTPRPISTNDAHSAWFGAVSGVINTSASTGSCAAAICRGRDATSSRLRRTTGAVTSTFTPAAASAWIARTAAVNPPGVRVMLSAASSPQATSCTRAVPRPARRELARTIVVDQLSIGLEHHVRAARRRALHEVGDIAPQRRLAAGQHDLACPARLRLRDAPPDRRLGHECRLLRRPPRVAEPAVLVAGLVGDDPLDVHAWRSVGPPAPWSLARAAHRSPMQGRRSLIGADRQDGKVECSNATGNASRCGSSLAIPAPW